jgi:phenylacetic acid degradation protein PaaD
VTSDPSAAPAASPAASPADRARQLLARDAASRWLGIELEEAGVGTARLRMTVRPDMVQGHGTCHGGLVVALADSAFAVACNTRGAGPSVAASADVTWVGPAFAGDVLVAQADEHVRTGRSGVTDVTVRRHGDGQVVALFRGRSVELRAVPVPAATA